MKTPNPRPDPESHENLARDFLMQVLGQMPPQYPAGKLSEDDQGELALAVALDRKSRTIIIRFPKPIDWMGFGKQDALALGQKLVDLANQLP